MRECSFESIAALIVVCALAASLHAQQQPPSVTPIPAPPDVAAPPADAAKTASGLRSKVLQKGTGTAQADESDLVTVQVHRLDD